MMQAPRQSEGGTGGWGLLVRALTLLCLLHIPALRAASKSSLEQQLDQVVLVRDGASVCAGVILPEGTGVATAYHCALGLQLEVETRAGERLAARRGAVDVRADLAILKVEGLEGQPGLPLRSSAPERGEALRVLGHPLGLEGGGWLQGLLRWSSASGEVSGVGPLMIQLDAPVNPGHSGGPVVDSEGRVLGLLSRKLRGAEGLAFAGRAARLEALLSEEESSSPWRGVQLELALQAGLDPARGLAAGPALLASWRKLLVMEVSARAPFGLQAELLQAGEAQWGLGSGLVGLQHQGSLEGTPWGVSLLGGLGLRGSQEGRIEDQRLQRDPLQVAAAPSAALQLRLGGVELGWRGTQAAEGWDLEVQWTLHWPGTLGIL